jgi:hypothetical protein
VLGVTAMPRDDLARLSDVQPDDGEVDGAVWPRPRHPGCRLGICGVTAILAVLMTLGADSLPLMMGFLFVSYGFLGVVIPTASVLALERHGIIAGTASALMGSIQMETGAAVMAIAGLFADGAPQPMVFGIAEKLEQMRVTVDEKLQGTLEQRLGASFFLPG